MKAYPNILSSHNIITGTILISAPLLTWMFYVAGGPILFKLLGPHVSLGDETTVHSVIRFTYKSFDLALFLLGMMNCIYAKKKYTRNPLSRTFLDWITILFITAFFTIYLGHLLKINPWFGEIRAEDSILEYMTFVLLSFTSIVLFQKGLSRGKSRPRFFLFVAGLLFLFIALEEVSWFQRILDLPLPDFFRTVNVQNELNIHNFSNHILPPIYAFCFYFLGSLFLSLSHQGNNRFKMNLAYFLDITTAQRLTSNYALYAHICYLTPLLFLLSWSHGQELSEEIFALLTASLALQSLRQKGTRTISPK